MRSRLTVTSYAPAGIFSIIHSIIKSSRHLVYISSSLERVLRPDSLQLVTPKSTLEEFLVFYHDKLTALLCCGGGYVCKLISS